VERDPGARHSRQRSKRRAAPPAGRPRRAHPGPAPARPRGRACLGRGQERAGRGTRRVAHLVDVAVDRRDGDPPPRPVRLRLRTIGFSSAPGILRMLALFDPLAGPIFLLCTLWMLAGMVVAVRQALDYSSTLRALAVCAIGFPIYAAILVVTLLLLGPWPL